MVQQSQCATEPSATRVGTESTLSPADLFEALTTVASNALDVLIGTAAYSIVAVSLAPLFLVGRIRNMDLPSTLRVME